MRPRRWSRRWRLGEKPEYRAWSVEVEDLGTDFQSDPDNDLLAWDEVS
jgi:hypothetical protein